FANVIRVGVEPGLIAGAEVFLEKSQLMRDRIQNAGVLLSSTGSLVRACSVAEQPLERHPRIDLCRKRLRGRRPRNGVRVSAAITKVATAEIAGVFNAELKGGQYRVLPPLLRDQL